MLQINLFIRKNKIEKNVYFRLTAHNSDLGTFSTGLFCKPHQWLGKRGCQVTGKMSQDDRNHNTRVNARIDELSQEFLNAWDNLKQNGQESITKDDLVDFVNGKHALNLSRRRRVLVSEAIEAFWNYHKATRKYNPSVKFHCRKLGERLTWLGYGENTTIDQVDRRIARKLVDSLLDDSFESKYLNGKYKLTTRKVIVNVWFMIFDYYFQNFDTLDFEPILPKVNPFQGIKVVPTNEEKEAEKMLEVHFYSDEQIEAIENIKLDGYLDYIRHVLLLQIYTGISRGDLFTFDPKLHVVVDIRGRKSIDNRRCKNGNQYFTPVDEKTEKVLDWLAENDRPGLMKPIESFIQYKHTTRLYRHLRDLEVKLKFQVSETHKARHTFAVQMLKKGWSMTSLSRMLGHAKVTTTERYYGFVTPDRITNERDMIEAQERLRANGMRINNDSKMTGTD